MSALPTFYWIVFGVYEPFLSLAGTLGAFLFPKQVSRAYLPLRIRGLSSFITTGAQTYVQQAPWPDGQVPEGPLPKATLVTLLQLAHTCGLLGVLNVFVLSAARKHLWSQPAIQEKIVGALLTPLLMGDILHIALTLWALGEERWDISRWEGTLWATIVAGLTLMVPRLAWYLGIGRYVDARDGHAVKK